MKKINYFKLLFIILLICGPILVKAEMISKDCTYTRTYHGDAKSQYNFTFTIRFTPTNPLGILGLKPELVGGSEGSEQLKAYYEKGGEVYTVEYSTKGTPAEYREAVEVPLIKKDGDNYYITDCPELFYDDQSEDKVIIYQVARPSGESQPLRPLQESTGNGEIISGDKENNNNKTICTLQIANYKVLNNTESNEVITLYVTTYEDGKIYIKCSDCFSYGGANGGYLEKNPNGENALEFKRGSTTAAVPTTFYIKNEDVDKIKKAYPYGLKEEDCPNLVFNNYGEKDVVISTDKKNDADKSGDATSSYNVADDELFFPKTNIDLNSFSCSELLGDNLISFIQSAWNIIKVVAIVLCIVFGILDFINSTSKDKDILMESVNKTIKRLIIVIIILLIPTFIEIIGKLFNISDILCGIE